MVSPLYLTLLIGPMEPLPAPKPLADALVSVEVTESADRAQRLSVDLYSRRQRDSGDVFSVRRRRLRCPSCAWCFW